MNLGELSGAKLLGVLVLVAVVGTGALYYTVFKSQRDENAAAQIKLQAKLRENAELEAYRPKLADIERQLASLKQQLEIERRIVPDEKEVDNFMRMVSGEARKSGVEIRRYTSRPYVAKEFYTEVPFEIELDGPYYDAWVLRPVGKGGAHHKRREPAGGLDPQAWRCQGETCLPVRAG
jgi:type IV pilus assembly protein PilO